MVLRTASSAAHNTEVLREPDWRTLHPATMLWKRRVRIDAVAMPPATAIVFVVDDDISVRESLELLIRVAAAEYSLAQESSTIRSLGPSSSSTSPPGLNGLNCSGSPERTDMPIIFITVAVMCRVGARRRAVSS